MTDDELRSMWVYGASLRAIAAASGRTKHSLQKYLQRKRDAEGADRWPRRQNPVPAQPKPAAEPIKRAGATTLSPLPSLEGSAIQAVVAEIIRQRGNE